MLSRILVILQITVLSLALPAAAASPPVPRGAEFRVNTSTATSHFIPSVAAFPDGGFVVVFNGNGVRARFLDAQGRPRREIPLAVSGIAEQVAADRDGSFLVVSYAGTPSSRARGIFVRRFNRDGSPRGKRIRVSNLSPSERRNPLIAIGEDGRFAIAWEAEARDPETGWIHTNAMARIFTAEGNPVTSEILLLAGDPASPAGDDVLDAFPSALVVKPDGSLVALVEDSENSCLHSYWRRSLRTEHPCLCTVSARCSVTRVTIAPGVRLWR